MPGGEQAVQPAGQAPPSKELGWHPQSGIPQTGQPPVVTHTVPEPHDEAVHSPGNSNPLSVPPSPFEQRIEGPIQLHCTPGCADTHSHSKSCTQPAWAAG